MTRWAREESGEGSQVGGCLCCTPVAQLQQATPHKAALSDTVAHLGLLARVGLAAVRGVALSDPLSAGAAAGGALTTARGAGLLYGSAALAGMGACLRAWGVGGAPGLLEPRVRNAYLPPSRATLPSRTSLSSR